MKKIFAILLSLALLCATFAAVAESTGGSTIKVLEITYSNIQNVPFEDSYVGFCITHNQPGASEGDAYDVAGTSGKILNEKQEDVSNIVKALLVECLDDFMIAQENGIYKVRSASAREKLYATIRWITGGYDEDHATMSSDIKAYIDKAKARAAQGEIPDTHVETYTFGTFSYNVTFDFRVFLTQNPETAPMQGQQNYFGFKVLNAAAAENFSPLPTVPPSTEGSGGEGSGGEGSGGEGSGGEGSGGNGNTGGGEPGEVDPALPETGDNANIGLWIALLAISGAAMFVFKRKSA